MTSGSLKENRSRNLLPLSRLLPYQHVPLVAMIAGTLFVLIVVARLSPLGTDDLMARISAQSSSLPEMVKLLREQPVNVDAPIFPVLAYCAAHLPLPIDYAIQVPLMTAICVALLALFFFMRDRLGLGAAYVAVGLLACNAYALYGAKGRPYALLLAGVSLTLLCWQRVIDNAPHRRLWLLALSASATFALLSHYFAIFALLAVAVAQGVRCLIQQQWKSPVWIALGAAVVLFVLTYLTFGAAAQPYRPHPFDRLHREDLLTTYKYTVSFRFVVVVLFATVLLAFWQGRPTSFRRLTIYDWVAATVLTLHPFLIYLAGRFYTHTYATRYGICAVLGVAIALSAIIHFIAGGDTKALLPASVAAFAFYLLHFLTLARQPVYRPEAAWANVTPAVLQPYHDIPLITPDFDFWMRIKFYAPRWLSSPITMVTDPESMLKYMGSENPALAALAIHRWTGWPIADYYDFVRHHRKFLMYGDYWMGTALQADGARIEFLSNVGPYRLYLVQLPPA